MASRQVVVRIPAELAGDLDRYVIRTRRKRSDILREALRSYLGRVLGRGRSPADGVAHLIGSLQTNRSDLAENSRRYVLESLRRGR